jgi:mRNA-degrading endonuclease toxin of MazEF toxin-antitoxin module
VIVVSNDGFNLTPTWRTAVPLAAGADGLPRAGVAICHQVTTLDRAKLIERLGVLSDATLAAVENGLKAALDLG